LIWWQTRSWMRLVCCNGLQPGHLRGPTPLRRAGAFSPGPEMALASLLPVQGPKKSRFSGPTPSNAPRNDVVPLKIITYRAIKNNRYINSYVVHIRLLFPLLFLTPSCLQNSRMISVSSSEFLLFFSSVCLSTSYRSPQRRKE
jgi:hypothetical protein